MPLDLPELTTVQYFRTRIALALLLTFASQLHQRARGDETVETPTQHTSPSSKPNLERVPQIVRIEYALADDDPTTLLVTAHGKLAAGEPNDVYLLRREYASPPADGIWEFDLLTAPLAAKATLPEKTGEGETELRATSRWEKYDQSMAGIRVYGIGKGVKEIKYHPDGCK